MDYAQLRVPMTSAPIESVKTELASVQKKIFDSCKDLKTCFIWYDSVNIKCDTVCEFELSDVCLWFKTYLFPLHHVLHRIVNISECFVWSVEGRDSREISVSGIVLLVSLLL